MTPLPKTQHNIPALVDLRPLVLLEAFRKVWTCWARAGASVELAKYLLGMDTLGINKIAFTTSLAHMVRIWI